MPPGKTAKFITPFFNSRAFTGTRQRQAATVPKDFTNQPVIYHYIYYASLLRKYAGWHLPVTRLLY
jgi:hypothetical protein